ERRDDEGALVPRPGGPHEDGSPRVVVGLVLLAGLGHAVLGQQTERFPACRPGGGDVVRGGGAQLGGEHVRAEPDPWVGGVAGHGYSFLSDVPGGSAGQLLLSPPPAVPLLRAAELG